MTVHFGIVKYMIGIFLNQFPTMQAWIIDRGCAKAMQKWKGFALPITKTPELSAQPA